MRLEFSRHKNIPTTVINSGTNPFNIKKIFTSMNIPEDGRSIPVAVKDITAGGIQINQAKEGRS